jgi:flagellar motor protein MotB
MLFLGGHSSEEGSSAYNLNLSARRVKSVQKFFIERGVSKKRLLIDFHGEDEPLYSNENEVGRAKNRRVDFEVKYHLHDDVEAKNLKNEYDSLINIIQGGIINNFDSTIIEDSGIDSEIFEDTIINADQIKSSEIINEIIIENKILEEAINNEVVKDLISIKVEENNYLVIVQVFSDERNAIEYIKDSKGELIYISRDGRFYVYVFASVDREASENFRSVYEESCWILNLN